MPQTKDYDVTTKKEKGYNVTTHKEKGYDVTTQTTTMTSLHRQ